MKKITILLCFCLMATIAQSQTIELQAEPNHSTLGFRVPIASGLTSVTGKFTDYDLKIDIDKATGSPILLAADIRVASIQTGIEARDEHLKSADFFDAAAHPSITFESTDISYDKKSKTYSAKGPFTMHGVTKNLTIPFEMSKLDGSTAGFKIRATVNRKDFGVGTSFVHDAIPDFLAENIEVEIDFWTRKRKQQQEQYTIKGQVAETVEDGKITLSTFDPVTQEKKLIASTQVAADGTYSLAYAFTEPDLFELNFFKKQKVVLVIDKGQKEVSVEVEGKKKGNVNITGSEDSEKLQGYEAFRKESYERLVRPTYNAMKAASKEADQQKEIEAVEAYAKASEESRKELIEYTAKNIGTSIALYGTVLRWTGDDKVARLDRLVKEFKQQYPKLKMTKVMEAKVNRFERLAIGANTPDFALPDSTGQVLKLKNLKGKYTLLDFWASWCGPCLLQIPDLKQAYGDYHDKGFEIIGISIDTKRDKWTKAINKYEMNWPNVSDLKGWGAEVANQYNVTFIPFNLLIDEEGKIIAKNLHSKTLQSKLKELLGE